MHDSIPVQFLDTHSPFEQPLAAVALHLALVQQIRDDELERQAEGRIQQRTAFQIYRSVGIESDPEYFDMACRAIPRLAIYRREQAELFQTL